MRGDGNKFDGGKRMWDLLPHNEVGEIVDVLTYGAKKYGVDNWKQTKDLDNRYYAACLRHIMEWRDGNSKDEESGISHLAHAACNLLFLAYMDNRELPNESN